MSSTLTRDLTLIGAAMAAGWCLRGLLLPAIKSEALVSGAATSQAKAAANIADAEHEANDDEEGWETESDEFLEDDDVDDDEEDDEDEDEEEDETAERVKMVLVVRNDLGMGKGKIGAQCGHGTLGAYKLALKTAPKFVRQWERNAQPKIALKANSEEELDTLYLVAKAHGLPAVVIHDAGHTQIAPNTKTVLAIGPAPDSQLDEITGHLKLL